jgi:hypothetical protein
MSAASRVILLEFNELCPNLMERFMAAGRLPHFERLYHESAVYTTDAEAAGEDLNPWVQWVTVHTGLAIAEHGVHHLSEGHRVPTKAVWDLLSDAGHRVWVCGSMNPRLDMPLNGYLLPDPWSTGVRPQPPGEFDDFFDYIRANVQEHTNEQGGAGAGAKRFLSFMLRHGLSPETVMRTAWQLASERLGENRWKRAMIMDRFQWDVFRHYYRKARPQFSTFFLNSTAHLQHCFWRHMDPSSFRSQPGERERQTYADSILQGYINMDDLIGKFLRLAGDGAIMIFCTALSQQPYVDFEDTGGRHYYRLRNPEKLGILLGSRIQFHLEPVMAEQFFLRFNSRAEAEQAEALLRSFRLNEERPFKNGRPVLFHLNWDGDSLLCQCRCTGVVSPGALILGETLANPVKFLDIFYQVDTVKSGHHHPDGMLWIRWPDRRHLFHQDKVSLSAIAPTILRMMEVAVPPFMTGQDLLADRSDHVMSAS